MPAVVQYGTGHKQVELREIEKPTFGEDEVLLRVGAVGVCGSEVHQYHGTHSWPVNVPVTLGHEFAGTVVDAGTESFGFKEGDRVVSETAAKICNECIYCRSAQYNLCPKRSGFGYDLDGAMTEYVRVPSRCLHRIPGAMPFETAALTEPCCVAYNAAVESCDIKPGDSVFILGPGPIGLLCLMYAKLRGASRLIIAGLSADAARFEVARQVGATDVLDLQRDDVTEFVRSIDDGNGADIVIDAAGASAAIQTSLDVVRPLGQIVKVGWGPQPLGFSLDPLTKKSVTMRGSFSHNYPIWERVIALLADGHLDIRPLIGLKVGLADWQQGFDGMHDGLFAKAVLLP